MQQLDKTKIKRMLNYRWIIWGTLILAYIIVYFHRMSIGVVKDDLTGTFGISETTFANLGSVYFYVYMAMQIPAGILADSLGARKTVTIGALLAGIGSIIFGLAPTIAVTFLGRFLVGIGVSVVFVPILKILSLWFKDSEFSTMTGITAFLGNMGGVAAQTPLALMVAAVTWKYTFIMIGVFTLIVAVLCYMLVRNTPAEMGLPSIAQIEGNETTSKQNKKPDIVKGLIKVITNKRTWPPFLFFTAFYSAYVCLTGSFGIAYMMDVYGISKVSAANYMMIAILGMGVGYMVIGGMSDRIGKRRLPILIFGTIYLVCWAIILFYPGGRPPLEIFGPLMFVFGFTNASYIPLFAQIKEVNPPEVTGISTAVVNIAGYLGAAVLPPLLGRVFDQFGKLLSPVELYQKAFMYCLIVSLAGFICHFFIKETNCRNIYNE